MEVLEHVQITVSRGVSHARMQSLDLETSGRRDLTLAIDQLDNLSLIPGPTHIVEGRKEETDF